MHDVATLYSLQRTSKPTRLAKQRAKIEALKTGYAYIYRVRQLIQSLRVLNSTLTRNLAWMASRRMAS
jgi:hypothetical protein